MDGHLDAGEVVVVVVPGALASAAAPVAEAPRYSRRFQATQGIAAAVGLYVGPLLAARGSGPFVWWCLLLGAVGAGAVVAARRTVRVSRWQPVGCPCGALFCTCGGRDTRCASPSVVVSHAFERRHSSRRPADRSSK